MRSFLAVVCSTLGLAVIAVPAEAKQRSCANVPGADQVGTTNLTCVSAHKLIRVWLVGVRRDGRYDRTVLQFRCRNRPSSEEGDTMVCVKGARRVVWYVNIPR